MKFLYLSLLISFFYSCSQTKEDQEIDIKQKYLTQAETFIQSKFDEDATKKGVQFESFKNLIVDSVSILTSQKLEQCKMIELNYDLQQELNLFEDLSNIDKTYGLSSSDVTLASAEKMIALQDSMSRWVDRNETLSNDDTLGYLVLFKFDVKMTDGSSKKKLPMAIAFDKEHDLSHDINKLIYWQ